MSGNVLKALGKRVKSIFQRREAFKILEQYHRQAHTLEDRVRWAMNFGGRGRFKILTIQQPVEITSLAKAVAELKPRKILEIGTAKGGTLLIWAALASDQVISCDLQDMSVQSDLYKALPPPGSRCRVDLLSGDSHDPAFKARVAGALAGDRVDFLFIDGDHTEAGVTADYQDYREFVRPGGIIAFHDILENQPLPVNQVYHLWKVLRDELDTEEFVQDSEQCGYGIGIVRVPAS